MKINRKELLEILNKLKFATSTKDIVEQFQHIVFTQDTIVCYNGELLISYPFKTDFKCTVPCEQFIKVLDKIKDEEIELSLEDNLIIKTKKVNIDLVFSDSDKIFETLKGFNFKKVQKKFKKLPDNFVENLFLCYPYCLKQLDNDGYDSIYVTEDKFICSDRQRVFLLKNKNGIENELIINNYFIPTLVRFKLKKYFLTKRNLYFKTVDNYLISITLYRDESSVDVLSNVVKEFNGKEIKLPSRLYENLDIATLFSEESDDYNEILIKFENKKMIVKASNEFGGFEKELKCNYKDEEIEFKVDPTFMMEFLHKCKNMYIDEGKILFEADNFKYLVVTYSD